ncbi:hypothetical protein [Flavobacterium sp. SUN046]|uniref:hypothetical protein n=1 Tax=Flavobacterium sp. SUN046 TaxID=3002440 RepID=UPI002DBC544D|nr:hypothetical protein [Flavobacterium sp. SUN046]
MKKHILILLIILTTTNLIQGQSWQWGKRGGSNDNMNAAGADKEEVIDLVTDSQNNIYMISRVGKNKGHIKKLGRSYKFAKKNIKWIFQYFHLFYQRDCYHTLIL